MDEKGTEEVLLYRQRGIAGEGYGLGFKGHLGFSIQTDGSCPSEDSNYCLVPKEPHSPQVCLWVLCGQRACLGSQHLDRPPHTPVSWLPSADLCVSCEPVSFYQHPSGHRTTILLRDMAFTMVGGLGVSASKLLLPSRA